MPEKIPRAILKPGLELRITEEDNSIKVSKTKVASNKEGNNKLLNSESLTLSIRMWKILFLENSAERASRRHQLTRLLSASMI